MNLQKIKNVYEFASIQMIWEFLNYIEFAQKWIQITILSLKVEIIYKGIGL